MNKQQAFDLVVKELERASLKYPPMLSNYDGFGILQEEVEELWTMIKLHHPNHDSMITDEAIQVAAMAIRFLIDRC